MNWYKKSARDLPWRHTRDPYKIWISEVMLQQTTVATVIPYWNEWIKKFPTVNDVAQAKEQEILSQWQGLGYYSRAKNIHKAAKIIVQNFEHSMPKNPNALEKLPGFGPYTVGAVLSIAFDQRVPIIDANIKRVVARILAFEDHVESRQKIKILAFLDSVMPTQGNNIFNQAMMELGALVCKKDPLCEICPVKNYCLAYKEKKQGDFPKPKIKNIKEIDAVVAILKNKEKFYLQKRPSKGLLADMWELPGGKIEPAETPLKALRRELKEELGIGVIKAHFLFKITHFYTSFRVKLHVFECETEGKLNLDKKHRWISPKDFAKYPMPAGTVKIFQKLLQT